MDWTQFCSYLQKVLTSVLIELRSSYKLSKYCYAKQIQEK